MLVFGYGGRPVILFPTSQGKYYEAKDHGLVDSVSWFIENGDIKLYCPSGIDHLSWYNKGIPAADRAKNQQLYDDFIYNEILGQAFEQTGRRKAVMAGCSFGAYHAANFSFRHPEKVNCMIAMSGIFDIRDYTDGYYDDQIYFNNPVDFLPADNRAALWDLGIILGTTEQDICLEQNQRLSAILEKKAMAHWLDIRGHQPHDWPVWQEMFPHYISIL